MKINYLKDRIFDFLNDRKVSVYAGSGKDYSYVSQIILQGKWLESLGFSIGDKVIVDCQPDRIVIEKENPLLEEKN